MPPMLFSALLQLHTTQKSQVFPLSLQLKGRPARFLDSPEPMTGGHPHPPHMASVWWVGLGLVRLIPVVAPKLQMSHPIVPQHTQSLISQPCHAMPGSRPWGLHAYFPLPSWA